MRDPTTGIILQSTPLNAQQDYVIDPFQGRVTLLRPLGSYASVNDTVRNGTSAGNIPVLVVNYEYTPAVGNISGYTIGGRATQWLGENIRIGGTAQRDESGRSDQKLIGGDVLLRYAAGTYLKGEIAQTKGPGIGQSNSVVGEAQSLPEFIASQCAVFPNRVAYIEGEATLTYRALGELSRCLARALANRCGVAPADRVAVM